MGALLDKDEKVSSWYIYRVYLYYIHIPGAGVGVDPNNPPEGAGAGEFTPKSPPALFAAGAIRRCSGSEVSHRIFCMI